MLQAELYLSIMQSASFVRLLVRLGFQLTAGPFLFFLATQQFLAHIFVGVFLPFHRDALFSSDPILYENRPRIFWNGN